MAQDSDRTFQAEINPIIQNKSKRFLTPEGEKVKNQNTKKGLLKVLSALAASAMLVLGAGTAAYADDEKYPTIPTGAEFGSLNIEKRSQPTSVPNPARNNGLEHDLDGNGITLPGAKFQIERIDVDLTSNAGWIAAGEMTVEQAGANKDGDFTPRELTTGSDGRLTFGVNDENATWATDVESRPANNLPLGLYLVTETETPEGYIGSQPFLITVPLTHPVDRDTWNYDVYVYPKNSNAPEKTVEDYDAYDSTDTVTWTIKSSVPLDGDKVTGYVVADVLDEHLDFVSAEAALQTASGVQLVEGDDYIVSPATATVAPVTVKITFTEDGLAKLTAAVKGDPNEDIIGDPNTKVVSTIVTRVNSVSEDGSIPNQAIIYDNESKADWLTENEPGDPDDPGDPSDEPKTKWGSVNFTKVRGDQGEDNGKPLAGAVFSVYKDDPTGKDQDWLATNALTAFNAAGSAETTFMSGSDGRVVIEGLRYSRFADGDNVDETDADAFQTYWLVEISSPDGYEVLAKPINFEVNDPETALAISGADAGALEEVVNVPHNAGFELPLTGGTGTLVITVLGIGVLAFVLLAGRRKGAAHRA